MTCRLLLVVVALIALATVEGRRGILKKAKGHARLEIECAGYPNIIADEPREAIKDLVCLDFDGTITEGYTTSQYDESMKDIPEERVAVFRTAVEEMRKKAYVGIMSNGITTVIQKYLDDWKIKVDFVSGNDFHEDAKLKVTRIACLASHYKGKFNHILLVDDSKPNLDALHENKATFAPTVIETMWIVKGGGSKGNSFLHAANGATTCETIFRHIAQDWAVIEEELEEPKTKDPGLTIVIPDNNSPDIVIIPEEKFCCCNCAKNTAVDQPFTTALAAQAVCAGEGPSAFVAQLASPDQSCRAECPNLCGTFFAKWCCCQNGHALGQAYPSFAAVRAVCVGGTRKILALHADQSCRAECPHVV